MASEGTGSSLHEKAPNYGTVLVVAEPWREGPSPPRHCVSVTWFLVKMGMKKEESVPGWSQKAEELDESAREMGDEKRVILMIPRQRAVRGSLTADGSSPPGGWCLEMFGVVTELGQRCQWHVLGRPGWC